MIASLSLPAFLALVLCIVFVGVVRATWLIAALPVLAFVVPSTRLELNSGSIYLVDVAILMAAFLVLRPTASRGRLRRSVHSLLLAFGCFMLSACVSLIRYGTVVGPSLLALRYLVWLLFGLIIIPRLVRSNLRATLRRSLLVSLGVLAFVAVIQVVSITGAEWFEEILYSETDGRSFRDFRLATLVGDGSPRAYGPHGSSTAFAGIAVLICALWLVAGGRSASRSERAFAWLSVLASITMSGSRHAALALLAAIAVSTMSSSHTRSGSRVERTRDMRWLVVLLAFAVLALVGPLGSRIAERGVWTDENILARVVDGPSGFLNRLTSDPSVAVTGVGIGATQLGDLSDDPRAGEGEVSNGALLFWFVLGVPGVVLAGRLVLIPLRSRAAAHLDLPTKRLVSVLAVVILVSDNYGFYNLVALGAWTGVLYAASCPFAEFGRETAASTGRREDSTALIQGSSRR